MDAFLTFLSSAFASLIASFVGARFALSRFREERVFDARREWQVRALQTTHELLGLTAEMAAHYQLNRAPSADLLKRHGDAVDNASRCMVEAKLYAGRESYEALSAAQRRLYDLIQEHATAMQTGVPRHVLVNNLHEQAKAIRRYHELVAVEAREHMRLPPVESQ